MKPATAALISYLAANDNVEVTDLYTIAPVGSSVLRYADYALASMTIPKANFAGSILNFAASGTQTFTRGPRFGRSKVTTKIGLEPPELDVTVNPSATHTIGTLTWQQFALAGGFDFAILELDRFFMPLGGDGITGPLNTNLGSIMWFYGLVSDIDISREGLKMKVRGMTNLLAQQQMPRRLFQTGCTHIFGDPMCGYDRINGKNALGTSTGLGQVTITALASSTSLVINATFAPSPSTAYNQGTIIGLAGANAGLTRTVLTVASNVVTLTKPFPYPVSTSDTFHVKPGCDHTSATCNSTFLNILRYGGFDYIPPPEIAL